MLLYTQYYCPYYLPLLSLMNTELLNHFNPKMTITLRDYQASQFPNSISMRMHNLLYHPRERFAVLSVEEGIRESKRSYRGVKASPYESDVPIANFV